MKSYTEQQGKELIDWNKILNDESVPISNYKRRAMDWVTCACGNLCDVIPRGRLGKPKDYKLKILGYFFSVEIENNDREGARETIQRIEKRSTEIINSRTYIDEGVVKRF